MRNRTLRDRFYLAIMKWVLRYTERKIEAFKRHIQDDQEMLVEMQKFGAREWMTKYLESNIKNNAARIKNYVEMYKRTREVLLREGLDRW